MAVLAGCGSRRMSGLEGEAVDAGVETGRLPRVADRAVHRRDRLVVVGMFDGDVGVTTDAGVRRVRGQFQFGLINEQ